MLRVGSWLNGSPVNDADELFDYHVVSSEPERIKPGATVVRNFGLASCYRGVSWEPDRTWCEYIDSVDGWLRDEAGALVRTGSGKYVWDHAKVDGREIARIMFQWLRQNPWCDGVMLEMLARQCVMPQWTVGRGWHGASVHWNRYFDEVCEILTVRNRSKKWIVTLNGRHEGFVTSDDLDMHATYNKLEGALIYPEFRDHHDSHDRAHGQYIISWDWWIEHMQRFPSILEGFAQPQWGDEWVEQYTRLHAGLCSLFDAICIRHVEQPGFWTSMNEWHPFYDTIKALGEPKIPARRDGEVWWRDYEHGTLMVNTARYEVRRLGVTVPPMDCVIQK